jgi:tetratricopeptide (TPR) repeat protein
VIHQATKNYSAALECYKHTLEIQEKTLRPAVYSNVGVTHQSMKEYTNALEIQEKALSVIHPDIAMTYNIMATVYIKIDDFKSALEHEERAVDIARETLPADHLNLQLFRNYLDRIRSTIQTT